MDKKFEEVADNTTQKLLEERKARRARFAELKCKIEENDGALEQKRNALNDMQVRYFHGMVDLAFFAGSDKLRARAEVERTALHKLLDEMAAGRKDYDHCAEEQDKLVKESNKLCEQIEVDEGSMGTLPGFVGGLLGGAVGRLLANAGSEKRQQTVPATEPPPASGGDPYDA
jgi:hypothetical protein